jgi:hypothetical protein
MRRVADDPSVAAALQLSYTRGHDLAGTTRATISSNGRYSIESDATRERTLTRVDGALSAPDRAAFWRTAGDAIDTPSSSRPLGDDEIPVLVAVTGDGVSRQLRVWDRDIAARPAFRAFEETMRRLVADASHGAILGP